jgi:hypothetical protein
MGLSPMCPHFSVFTLLYSSHAWCTMRPFTSQDCPSDGADILRQLLEGIPFLQSAVCSPVPPFLFTVHGCWRIMQLHVWRILLRLLGTCLIVRHKQLSRRLSRPVPTCHSALSSVVNPQRNENRQVLFNLWSVFPQLTLHMKNAVFWGVMPYGSWFLQEPHGLISQKMLSFLVTAVKT